MQRTGHWYRGWTVCIVTASEPCEQVATHARALKELAVVGEHAHEELCVEAQQ